MGDGATSERRSSRPSAASPTSQRLEQVDLICQRAILIIVLAILVWAPLAMGAVRLVDFVPVQVMTALALVLWTVRFWTQRPFRLLWPPVCWGVYAFALYALVRCQIVDIPFVARCELFQVLIYAILFIVIVNNLNQRESGEILTTTLIVVAMALSLFAVFQFATRSSSVGFYGWVHRPAQYIGRGSGTFINPNNFAGFIEMLIPLGLAYVLLSRMSATVKVFIAYATVVMLAGLCVSISRGAMAATGLALALMCVALLFEGGSFLPALLALLVISGVALGVRYGFSSVERRFEQAEGPKIINDDRQFYWPLALRIFDDHKLWGAGPGHFDQETFIYRPDRLQGRLIYAHNEYLNTLADWGLAGLAIITAVAGLILHGAWRAWRSVRRTAGDIGRRKSDKAALVMGGAFGFVALLVHCAVDFDMHIPAVALLAVALMALLAAHTRFVTERHWKDPGPFGKVILALAAVLSGGYVMAHAIQQGRAQRAVEQAKADERLLEIPVDPAAADPEAAALSPLRQAAFQDKIASLKQAYEIDPTDPDVCFDLGSTYWSVANQGAKGYERDTLEAMQWYSRAILANPLKAVSWLQYGVCLDWMDRHQEADFYFTRARALDTNGWYVTFCQGKHLVELNRLSEAKELFLWASVHNGWNRDTVEYIEMVDRRLADAARK